MEFIHKHYFNNNNFDVLDSYGNSLIKTIKVATVSVQDEDTDPDKIVAKLSPPNSSENYEFAIKNGDVNDDFKIDNTGILRYKHKLSVTRIVERVLSIEAYNSNQSVFFNINIMVYPAVVKITVPENTSVGTSVGFLTEARTTMKWNRNFIKPLSFNNFRIDTGTGEVVLKQPLDFESYENCSTNIEVYDFHNNKNVANIDLEIVIGDTSERPYFYQETYEFKIQRSVPTNTLVGSVRANDEDAGDRITFGINTSNTIYYDLTMNETTQTQFMEIDNNGHIKTTSDIPEYIRLCKLCITATDTNSPPNTTSVYVSVKIIDQ